MKLGPTWKAELPTIGLAVGCGLIALGIAEWWDKVTASLLGMAVVMISLLAAAVWGKDRPE